MKLCVAAQPSKKDDGERIDESDSTSTTEWDTQRCEDGSGLCVDTNMMRDDV